MWESGFPVIHVTTSEWSVDPIRFLILVSPLFYHMYDRGLLEGQDVGPRHQDVG